jgi:hypothetical protein
MSGRKQKIVWMREYSGEGLTPIQKLNGDLHKGSFNADDIISIVPQEKDGFQWITVYIRQ